MFMLTGSVPFAKFLIIFTTISDALLADLQNTVVPSGNVNSYKNVDNNTSGYGCLKGVKKKEVSVSVLLIKIPFIYIYFFFIFIFHHKIKCQKQMIAIKS